MWLLVSIPISFKWQLAERQKQETAWGFIAAYGLKINPTFVQIYFL